MDFISLLLDIVPLSHLANTDRVVLLYASLCDRFEENPRLAAAGGEHLGCYRDRLESRALGGYVRHRWQLNRRTACTSMCSR